ncbi:GTPase HflX [Gemmata sp. G18]|uniref:GTPase HflX n=1 Tax=Gemmata palustris TaxID=2822762 RepID=A0ABS5BW98_9BACT|nr:GTPase HflX [Gemmata palustris]MBP3958012.1 GTPase HflX [Gemmata palustris]
MTISKAFDTQREEFSVASEKAVLVSVSLPERPWPNEADPCDEIRGLAESAGATVVGQLTQKRHDVQLATYLGSGKVGELHELVEGADADVVIFDNDLFPGQARNLEQALGVKVLDRSELILDIFASRARTAESKLQVELAQLEYSLPRLKQMWSHLSRQKGGGIGLRGPGETQLESDRRLVQHRIRDLKHKLNEVLARKEREVKSRSAEHTISLVGYTNAGKSQLMNTLTKAGVYVKNQLFSTLDTRTRQWHIRDWGRVLLSDTVGFIRDLPHHLVASFKATLSEARHAKLLLHVVDASSPQAEDHIRAVTAVLKELDCDQKPTLLVLNKIDKLADRSLLTVLEAHHPRAVAVSGLTGEGIERLEDAVMEALAEDFAEAEVVTDSGNGRVLAFLNAHAEIYRQEFRDDANEVVIRCHLPKHLLHHIAGPTVKVRFVEREKSIATEVAERESA